MEMVVVEALVILDLADHFSSPESGAGEHFF